jgi:hypothetical protein
VRSSAAQCFALSRACYIHGVRAALPSTIVLTVCCASSMHVVNIQRLGVRTETLRTQRNIHVIAEIHEPVHAGITLSTAGCATGLLLGAAAGPGPALMQCAMIGGISGYMATKDMMPHVDAPSPAEARMLAPVSRSGTAADRTAQHTRCAHGCCSTALALPRQPTFEPGLWGKVQGTLLRVWKSQSQCGACRRDAGALACASSAGSIAAPRVRAAQLPPARVASIGHRKPALQMAIKGRRVATARELHEDVRG